MYQFLYYPKDKRIPYVKVVCHSKKAFLKELQECMKKDVKIKIEKMEE